MNCADTTKGQRMDLKRLDTTQRKLRALRASIRLLLQATRENSQNHLAKRRFHQGRSWWLNISDANAAASRFDLSSCARCVCRISPAVGYQLGMFLTVSVFLDILFTVISGCFQSGKKSCQPLFDRVVPYLSPNLHADSAKNRWVYDMNEPYCGSSLRGNLRPKQLHLCLSKLT